MKAPKTITAKELRGEFAKTTVNNIIVEATDELVLTDNIPEREIIELGQ